MKRRIISILTALALCLGLCPATALAEEGDAPPADAVAQVGDTTYTDFNEAWRAALAASPATVTLLDNVTLPDKLGLAVESGQDITFEGGGFTLTAPNVAGVLTVNGGKLTVKSGTIENNGAGEAVKVIGGQFEMSGGALKGPTALEIQNFSNNVQLSGGSLTGSEFAMSFTGSNPMVILKNYGGKTDPHYAFYKDNQPYKTIVSYLSAGTFTVQECTHEGIEPSIGLHGLKCPCCGFNESHTATPSATANGNVITVSQGCEVDGCNEKGELGIVTVSIPELVYGDLSGEISLTTMLQDVWLVEIKVDQYDKKNILPTVGVPSSHTIGDLTGDKTLEAGEHTLTVTITLIGASYEEYHVSCTLTFTVARASLTPSYVVAENRTYEEGNRTVTLISAVKGEADDAVIVEFPANTTGTIFSENAGTYTEVTMGTVEVGNYSIPAGTYPVRGRTGNETPSADGVIISKAQHGGTIGKDFSVKFGTAATCDLTDTLKDYAGAELGELTVEGDIFDGMPTISNNVVSYKVKADARVGDTGTVKVPVDCTNYEDVTLAINVTVAAKFVPIVTIDPITVAYTGKPILNSVIHGTAVYDGKNVPGRWEFMRTDDLVDADRYHADIRFVPDDEENYETVTVEGFLVVITPASLSGTPTYTAISASGKTLADAALTAPEGWPKGILAQGHPGLEPARGHGGDGQHPV